MTATALDHVGVAARELDPLAAAYARMGFTLTPRARHSGRELADGPVVPYGTGNRCVMLREGYVELIAILDPAAELNGLDRQLARYAGIHILALGTEAPDDDVARLRRGGLDIPGVAHLERPVSDAEPDGARARFSLVKLPDPPEGRVQLIRHETPEALWQPRFLDHANHAVALRAVVLAVAAPAETAARFSRLCGVPATPDPAGGFRLTLARGLVRILPEAALDAVFPGVAAPAVPFIAGVVLGTDDGNRAVTRILAEAGVPHAPAPGGVLVPPEAAGGAALLFGDMP